MKKNSDNDRERRRAAARRAEVSRVRENKKRSKRRQNQPAAGTLRCSQSLKIFRNSLSNKIGYISRKNTIHLKIPDTFSLLENPYAVAEVYHRLIGETVRNPKCKTIQINHSRLKKFDLGAEKILDHLTNQIAYERQLGQPRLRLKGSFPTLRKADRFIRGVGIIRSLNLEHKYLDESAEKAIEIFERVQTSTLKSIRKPSESTPKEIAVQKFSDHIDKCLAVAERQLTDIGRHRLCETVSEIIDNVEQHSNGTDWVVAGYLDADDLSNTCEITVFNFGKSIAETFSDLPDDHFSAQLVQPYIEKHRKQGLFDASWKEDDLRTLIALQENVSAKNSSDDDTRGVGTVDLITFFQELYDENCSQMDAKPRMSITSGSTHILFDGRYRMTEGAHNRAVIAFNDTNNLSEKPDRSCFTDLSDYPFPGTAICLRFALTGEVDLTEAHQEFEHEATVYE